MGTQGRGMGTGKNTVPLAVYYAALALCVTAPKQEHHTLTLPVDDIDHPVSKGLPAFALVRGGTPAFHRQYAVEQQHTLVSPTCKIAMSGNPV